MRAGDYSMTDVCQMLQDTPSVEEADTWPSGLRVAGNIPDETLQVRARASPIHPSTRANLDVYSHSQESINVIYAM
jgi:hypothetical protein